VSRTTRTAEAVGGGLVILASVQFGIVVILGKLAQRSGIAVFSMLAVRFGLAAVAIAILLIVLRQTLLAARSERWWLVALGVLGYSIESALFFFALRHGEAAAVTLLFFTYPVFVAVVSIALGRGTPRPSIWIALLCAMSGSVLVIAFSGTLAISSIGVVFAIGSALSFTAYLLVLDHVVHRTDPLVASMWVAGWAAVALLVYALATGGSWTTSGAKTWIQMAGMGVCTAGAFVCLFMGLKRLGPVRTSIIAAAEPLATTVLAWAILDEQIHPAMAVGGVLILAGAITATVAGQPVTPPEPPVP
jgi:drug/metabolite transporter (DMT)-like permease